MVTLTVKVPEETLRRLKEEARAAGCSVASLVRERIERAVPVDDSFYALTADLAGAAGTGSGRSATNARAKFSKRSKPR